MLLADIDGGTAALVVVTNIISGAVVWLVSEWKQSHKEKRADEAKDEETTIGRLEKLLVRVDQDRKESKAENDELQKQLDAMRKELVDAKVLSARAITWIKHLESALDRAKLPYTKWEDGGTAALGIRPGSPAASVEGSEL